jgi:DNA-binding NtrC family response regulator
MNDKTGTSSQRDVLLVAADLNERRLIYGELLEAGYDVLPVPGIVRALALLLPHSVEPRLVLLDVRDDKEASPQSVDYLASLVAGIPLIVVVGSIDRAIWEPLAGKVAALVHRPVTIGQIVDVVKRTLPVSGPNS